MNTNAVLARIMLFVSASCIWVYNEKPLVCYKKYLGPDWKPDYDITRVGSIISNHQAFLDPVLLAIFVMPCHVAKGEVQDVPFFGKLCKIVNCMFLDRSNKTSKELI